MIQNNRQLSLRFLCVGIESNFIAYLLTVAESLNKSLTLSFDNCRTQEEALQKIAAISYEAYLLDAELLGAAISTIVDVIRQASQEQGVIALISASPTTEHLSPLKEKKIIDFILKKPIYPQQIDQFLEELLLKHTPEEERPLSAKQKELKRNYDETRSDKIQLLEKLAKSLQEHPNEDHLREWHEALHKIGGSAGSYGYPSVSELCKEIGSQAKEKLETKAVLDAQWLSSLDEYIDKIRSGFQISSLNKSRLNTLAAHIQRPHLYLVDDDQEFLNLMDRLKERFSLEITTESDPAKALKKIQEIDFNPNAVTISQKFSHSTMTAFDFMDVMHQKLKQHPMLFALILEEDSIEHRVDAMANGVDYIFKKPISAYSFLKSMKEALNVESLSHFKVLVLDDDPDFCDFVTFVLSESGMTVKSLNDSKNLFRELDEYRPNVLLLDLILPKYDGLKLLKALRQDAAYNHLIIVVVTSSEEINTRLEAYSAKADDILYKPIDPNLLKDRIFNIAARHRLVKELPGFQEHTGFANFSALIAALHKCLLASDTRNQQLALFEVNHYAHWVSQKGPAAASDLLVSISNQLLLETDQNMDCFACSPSKFAIIFHDITLQSSKRKLFDLFTDLRKKAELEEISFNCSIVTISKQSGNAQQVLQQAEQGLVDAASQETAPIRITAIDSATQNQSKKEVFLVDPDEALLKILKTAFESHNIEVKTFKEGGELLKEILKAKDHALPDLIVSERKLPDMDGLDLCRRLNTQLKKEVPFYFLTIFSSDKDVSEALTHNVSEYIIKPFNISIFMQKALKTIFKK